MKKTLAKTLRSALALVLALVMTLGTVGTTFAAEVPEDLDAAVAKLVALLEQYGPNAVEAAHEYAVEHGYVELAKEYASAIRAELAAAADEHAYLTAEVKGALEGYTAQINELKAKAKVTVALIELFEDGELELNYDREAIKAKLVAKLDPELKEIIKNSDLVNSVEESSLINNIVDEAVAKIEGLTRQELLEEQRAVKTDLYNLLARIDSLDDAIAEAKAALAKLDLGREDLTAAAAKCEELAQRLFAVLMEEPNKEELITGAQVIAAKYVDLRNKLFDALSEVDKAYTYMDDIAKTAVQAAKNIVKESKAVAEIVAVDLKNTVANNKTEIANAVIKAGEKVGVTQETIEKALAKIERLAPGFADDLKVLLKKLKDAVYKIIKNATTADYEINYDSYYVAIGDATANADESYADRLNAALYLPQAADKSMTGALLIQDTVLNAEKIAKADLITIGYSTANFGASMAEAVVGAQVAWNTYIPATGVAAIDAVMDEIEGYLKAIGFSANATKAMSSAIENIAFNALAYAYELPKTISEIRAINPDAVLVVVGLDNPLENCKVTYHSNSVSVDKLMDGILALTDIYTLTYAILAGNCTFVAAPNAKNDLEGSSVDVNKYAETLVLDFEAMLPNAEGQEYIKNRIYNSLRITCNYLWGDVNVDRQVDYMDSVAMLRYDVGLYTEKDLCMFVFDVNADTNCDYQDAVQVLRYDVGLITKFPVEK